MTAPPNLQALPVEAMFSIANTTALLAWVALIALPRWRWLRRGLIATVVLGLCVLYAVLIQVGFFRVPGGSFGSLTAVQQLFTSREVALAGWVHYLAFDLAIGLWMAAQADRIGLSRWLQAPMLAATFMFGPIGLLLLAAAHWAATRSAATPSDPGPPPTAVQLAWITAALCGVLALPSLLAAALDARTLNGISVWAKPLKFQLSFALHWATVALLLPCMAAAARQAPITRRLVLAGGVASLGEVLYITLQAARGRASHFNIDTLWERLMYSGVMSTGAVLIVGGTAWLGWRVWRHPDLARGAGLRLGAALGLMLGGALTLLAAIPLSSGMGGELGHWVGGLRTDAQGLPLVGWSTTGGDLRVPHFVATHLLQALPLLGLLADRRAPRQVRAWVWAGAGLGTAVMVLTLAQALAGRPLLG